MSKTERFTVRNGKGKILATTNDIKEALTLKEEHKHESAYIEDNKSPNKHKTTYFH